MSKTLLQLVQAVASEIGIAAPAQAANNASQAIIQMVALLNACGSELIRKHNWSALAKPNTFLTQYINTMGTVTAGSAVITGIPATGGLDMSFLVVGGGFPNVTQIQSVDSPTQVTASMPSSLNQAGASLSFQKVIYPLPVDYDSIAPRTQWDKSKHWEMLGPESPQQWAWIRSGFIATGPRVRWRLFGKNFEIWPGFSTPEMLAFEYRSNAWAQSSAGVPQQALLADSDTCIFADRLMINMAKLKFFEAKGFDTTAMYRNWMTELETEMAQDASYPNLSFAPRPGNILIGWDNIPDSGYGFPHS